jgi:catechol 2,3-dioxygenase-like lactoylglutathione lyase family enzyme
MSSVPELAVGHLILHCKDIKESYVFYAGLGMRALGLYEETGILELRGGTHLLLCSQSRADLHKLPESRVGQLSSQVKRNERLDFILSSKKPEDLARFRNELLFAKVDADEIQQDEFGHHFFSIRDPDGYCVTLYTSHVGALPV